MNDDNSLKLEIQMSLNRRMNEYIVILYKHALEYYTALKRDGL